MKTRKTKAETYASRKRAEEMIEDIESSGHNSRIGVAQVYLRDAYRAGQRRVPRG